MTKLNMSCRSIFVSILQYRLQLKSHAGLSWGLSELYPELCGHSWGLSWGLPGLPGEINGLC